MNLPPGFELEGGPNLPPGFELEEAPQRTNLLQDIASGGVQAMSKGAQGVLGAAAGLSSLFGASDEFTQPFFEAQQSVRDYWNSVDPARGKEQGVTGKIASGLAQLPAWLGPQAAFQVAGQATEQGQSVINEGGDLSTALSAYGVSAATNAALAALPAYARGEILKRLATGAAVGAGSTGVEPWLINEIRKAQGLPEIPMPQMEDYLAGAALGGGIGALGGQAPKPKQETNALAKLDEIKPTEPPVTPPEGFQLTPEYKSQGDLNLEPPIVDSTNVVNKYDLGGQVTALKEGADTTLDTPQLDLFAQPKPDIINEAPSQKFGLSDTDQAGAKGINKYLAGYDETRGTIDTARTLDVIGKTPERAQYLPLVDSLKRIVNEFGTEILPTIRLQEIRDRQGNTVLDEYARAPGVEGGSSGYYNRTRHEVVLGRKGMNDGTILHELVHGMTVRFMEYRPNDPAVQEINSLFNDLKNSGKFDDLYALRNPYEMVAEAFASPTFQKRLAEFKSNPSRQTIGSLAQSGWLRFVNAVRRLFNLPAQEFSALENVIGLSNRVMRSQAKEFQALRVDALKEYESWLKKIDPEQFDAFGIKEPSKSIPDSSKFEHPMAMEEKRTDAFSKTPIGRALDGAMIPEDVSVDSVIKAGLESPDASGGSALIGGGTMLAEIKNNPVVYGVTQWFNNAKKRADFNIRKYVKPSERAMNTALQQDSSILHGIFMREMKNDARYSMQQLMDAGIPEKQITAYMEFREMMDAAWTAQNNALVAIGEKPLTKREAYISSRWSGNWRTPVYDKKGRMVFYIAENSKRGAEKALAYLAKNDPEIDLSKSKVEYRGLKQRGGVEAGYQEMLKVLDKDDPRVAALKSAYEEYVTQSGEAALGQSKHFENKAGIRGFIGDRPWVDTHQDRVEMFRQQFQYAKNAFEWAELQKAVDKSKKVFSNPELQEKQPTAITLGKEYAKNSLGFGEAKVVQQIENVVAEGLGISPQTMSQIVGVPRTAFYWLNLGFVNLPYSAISLIQPIYTLPWHRKLTAEGYTHNPVKTLSFGMQDAIGMMIQELGGIAPMTKLGEKARKYALDNGIIDINAMSDVADVGRSQTVQTVEKWITANMTYTEKMARSVAFMNYVHHLAQSGKFADEVSMFQRAEELTNLSMADYRVQERAPIFNKLGITGSALSTLNTFKINQFNQLYKLSKDAAKGNPTPLMSLLALQFTMAGAMGIFAIETLDSIWETMKEFLPAKYYNEVKDMSIKGSLAKAAFNNPDKSWLVYGGASSITGVNLSSRFDAGTVIDPTWEGLFPFAGDALDRGSKIMGVLAEPTSKVAQAQAVQGVLPASLKGAHQVNSDVFQVGDIATKLNDPTEGMYRRNETEKELKKYGFTGLKEATEKEILFRGDRKVRQQNEKRKDVAQKIKQAALFGQPEKLKEFVTLYNDLDGNVQELEQMIGEAALKQAITKLERLQMKAKTPQGARKLEEYVR